MYNSTHSQSSGCVLLHIEDKMMTRILLDDTNLRALLSDDTVNEYFRNAGVIYNLDIVNMFGDTLFHDAITKINSRDKSVDVEVKKHSIKGYTLYEIVVHNKKNIGWRKILCRWDGSGTKLEVIPAFGENAKRLHNVKELKPLITVNPPGMYPLIAWRLTRA